MKLAGELREAFRRYCGDNPSLGLSAGIALVSDREPLNRSADAAEEALERAKARPGKDALGILGEVLDWREPNRGLPWLLEKQDWLFAWLREDETKTSFAYKLLSFLELKDRAEEQADSWAAIWRARYGYFLARTFPPSSAEREARRQPAIWQEFHALMGLNVKGRAPALEARDRHGTLAQGEEERMNGRGPQHQRHGQGPGGNPAAGGGTRRPSPAERIEPRLKDRERIAYFQKPADEGAKPAPRAELFDKEAEQLAQKLATIPASQLRRFYSGVRSIKRQIDLDKKLGIDFIKAEMALLKAKSAYALARMNPDTNQDRDPYELLTLIVRHANSLEDRASFNAFVRHFEAVMAYHKVFEVKRPNQ